MILDEILRLILVFLYDLIGNYGVSILALSLVVFIIMLPLFWLTEKLQNKERIRKAEMQPLLDKIEGVQNKQEKYYYTKEIYKKYNYKAYYSLTGLIGLLIQIPFFLAAYWMLSDFNAFSGQSFGPIVDLHQPDSLINIGALKVNMLPFLMTIVNLVAIYFERDRLDNKVIKQLVGTAILFLVFLYGCSSALVLYWTANNFFSIFKNKIISSDYKHYVSNSPKREFRAASIRNVIYKYEREIYNLLSILVGYFIVNHVVLTILDRHSLSSMVFLTLTLLTLVSLFFLSSFIKKKVEILVSVIYALVVFGSIFFMLKSDTNLPTLSYLSIEEELIFNYVLVLFGWVFLIWKLKTTQHSDNKVTVFFMPKKNYFLFISLSIPLTIYLQSNSEYFSFASGFIYYLIMVGLPIIVFQIIWLLFQKGINQNIYVPSFVAAILTFFLVPIVTDLTQLNSGNNYLPHLLLLYLLIGVFVFLHKLDKKILPFLMLSVLAIVVFQKVFENNRSKVVEEHVNAAEQFFSSQKIKHKPDIYLLIYDAYVEEDQMKTMYNIDNSKQMEFLKAQKFNIHKNVYSTGRKSLESMSNIVNLSNIFDGNFEYRKKVNGESVINRILQKNGYLTYNILNPYMIRGSKQKVDYCYPSSGVGMFTIVEAILIGEFKFDIEFSGGYNEWIDKKNEILQKDNHKPIFLYAHSKYPGHSQNSGTLLPNENQLFENRLKKANKEMKNDLSQILQNDKESIIIIAGDHGPYLTGDGKRMLKYDEVDITSDHILDRYGVFLAVRYPDNWKSSYGNKVDVIQEVFVNVLAKMCEVKAPRNLVGKESSILNERIRTPVINNGVIQIGQSKGERLYK